MTTPWPWETFGFWVAVWVVGAVADAAVFWFGVANPEERRNPVIAVFGIATALILSWVGVATWLAGRIFGRDDE